MTRTWTPLALLVAAALVPAMARADDDAPAPKPAPVPIAADLVHGARAYRLACAACHGVVAAGDGPLASSQSPRPADLRDGGVLWAHPEDEFISMVLTNTGMPEGTPPHGRDLTALDVRDILAWIKAPVPELGSMFPAASEYIAHKQTIDDYGLERVKKVLGEALPSSDKSLTVYTMFRPDDATANLNPGHPTKIPEDPGELYKARPKRKLGYITYQELDLGGSTVRVAMALDRNMRLIDIRSLPGEDEKQEKMRVKLESVLKSYIGSGGRIDRKPVGPAKGKPQKEVQKAMLKAYELALETATMYDKEERERFWAEPDAFKNTASDSTTSSDSP